jgi:transcriptional regulator with XRE-family HTH domain
MFITFADLAKLKGVSRSAVSQRRQSGILDAAIVKVGAREKLNKDLALELWEKNTAPVLNQLPVQTKKELKKQIDALPDDEIPDFNTSRARKEHWQASLAQLQVEQQKKDLIPVTEIKKSSFELGRAIRESLANLADRLAPQCAGETDPQIIHQLLTEEHRNALEELAKE